VTTNTWFASPGPGLGLQWGGIGARLGALLIDAVLIVCVLFGAGLLISFLDPSGTSANAQSPQSTAISLAWVLFAVIYHPVCWYAFGATPGQRSLGLRVTQASNGAHVEMSAVLVRFVIFAMATVMVPLGVISGVMASQDPFKRAWHDQVARTVVVRKA
jgi:uncharacterized RDD family membrane protein YckC